jgi:hypothetical protein
MHSFDPLFFEVATLMLEISTPARRVSSIINTRNRNSGSYAQGSIKVNQVYCQLYRINYEGIQATYRVYKWDVLETSAGQTQAARHIATLSSTSLVLARPIWRPAPPVYRLLPSPAFDSWINVQFVPHKLAAVTLSKAQPSRLGRQ